MNALRGREGIYGKDLQGRRRMDFHGNNVHQAGFSNPAVIAAIKAQLDQLSFCTRRYTNRVAVELARKLAQIAPGNQLADCRPLRELDPFGHILRERIRTVAPWINEWDNLLVSRTFSKGFGLAGLRLGYLLANPKIIQYINRVRHVFNVNLVAIVAAEASLDDMDNVKARLDEQRQTREWLTKELEQIPGLRPIPSQSNSILVDVADSGRKAAEYVEILFERNIFVRDFSIKQGLESDRYFRITVGQRGGMEQLAQELREIDTRISTERAINSSRALSLSPSSDTSL